MPFIWVKITMLVEFRVKNYRSIKNEQVLSLVAASGDTLKDNCIDVGKLRLLKAAGIYGPNASGKSNLIRAMRTMQQMILNSAGDKPGSGTSAEPFLFDDKSQKEPTSFEIIFYHNKIRYQYGFTATKERIHDEWLFASPKKSNQKWFERSFDKKTGKTDWKFGSYYKGEKMNLADKTRDNALFLSVAAQWNHEQLTSVYKCLNFNLKCNTHNSLSNNVLPPRKFVRAPRQPNCPDPPAETAPIWLSAQTIFLSIFTQFQSF